MWYLRGMRMLTSALALAILVVPALALAAPKYYVELKDTEEQPGVKSGLVDEAKRLLQKQLEQRADVQLAASGAKWPSDEELKGKGQRGLQMIVRIEKLDEQVAPPADGKKFKTLQVSLRTSVLGTLIPSKQMILAGDGECTVATEISGAASDAEKKQLRKEALVDALKQSVDKAFGKLGEKPRSGGKKKKKS